MADVRVPYADLDEVLVQVSQVRELFEGASGSTAGAESVVGHPRLVGRVTDFSNAWDRHRKDLVAACEAMEQAVRDTKGQFEAWEDAMADGATSLTAGARGRG